MFSFQFLDQIRRELQLYEFNTYRGRVELSCVGDVYCALWIKI